MENDKDYSVKCNKCGLYFDARDLNQVLLHEHINDRDVSINHFISQKKGDNKQWLDGRSEIDLN